MTGYDWEILSGVLFFASIPLWIWIGNVTSAYSTNKTKALAWTFLTWEDAIGDKLKAEWLKEPGRFVREIEAWNISRSMRTRLRGDSLDRRSNSLLSS